MSIRGQAPWAGTVDRHRGQAPRAGIAGKHRGQAPWAGGMGTAPRSHGGAWGFVMEQHETKPGALGALGALKRRFGVFGDLLILALVVGGWFLLQAVILPRLGINT